MPLFNFGWWFPNHGTALVRIGVPRQEVSLDTQSIIAELEAERDRLDTAIAALRPEEPWE